MAFWPLNPLAQAGSSPGVLKETFELAGGGGGGPDRFFQCQANEHLHSPEIASAALHPGGRGGSGPRSHLASGSFCGDIEQDRSPVLETGHLPI